MKCFNQFIYVVFLFVFISAVINEELTTTDTTVQDVCIKCSCENNILDCSGNDYVDFNDDYWSAISSLEIRTLNYSHNIMGSLPAFPSLPLQTLDLSHCDIETIATGAFSSLTELEYLDLSYNKLTGSSISLRVFLVPIGPGEKPKQFGKIKYLNLSNNNIHTLSNDIFIFMRELSVLDLSENPLGSIDQVTMAAITVLVNLQELKLSGCELTSIPEGLLRRLTSLRILDISNNKFTTIPSVLTETAGLIKLNFARNPVPIIQTANALKNMTSLQDLNMSRLNKLTSIEPYALAVRSLNKLELNHNPRLTNLDPNFMVFESDDGKEWPLLKELYLNNNNLSGIDGATFDRWDKLAILDLTQNPYNCDCKIQWMVHTLVGILESGSLNGSDSFMICNLPPELKGLSFKYLSDTKQTLECADQRIDQGAVNDVIIFGIIIGVLVSFPLVMLIVILWRKGYFSRWRGRTVHYHHSDEDLEYL